VSKHIEQVQQFRADCNHNLLYNSYLMCKAAAHYKAIAIH